MTDVTVRFGGTTIAVSAALRGPTGATGATGASGTLGNNSGGIVSTPVPAGFGHRFDTSAGEGYSISQFGADENYLQLWYFGEGGEFRTRKFGIVSGVTSDTDTSPAGIAARQLTTYRSTIYGSSWQSSMWQYWSDVDGPTIQVRQSYAPSVAMSFVDRTGEENFIITGHKGGGELRWHLPGSEPVLEDHITDPAMGGGFGTLTADDAPLRVRAHYNINYTGMMFYHKDGGVAGAGGVNCVILGPNSAIVGMGTGVDANGVPNGTPQPLIQIESGTVCRIGGPSIDTVINGALVSSEKPFKLPSYTVATLPSAATHSRGLIYVADGTSNKRLAISDGTNWRFPDGAIVS